MQRQHIHSGSSFEQQAAYARALVVGDWVFVSGTTGFDYQTMTIDDDLVVQTEQCFRNIIAALTAANSSLKEVVRIRYILPNAKDFERCWPILRKYLEEVQPAATMIEAGLADKRMKIEIEVTAFKGG